MSWEEMGTDIEPCWCGKGTIKYITEMDDWNRVRTSREINCPECMEKERIRNAEESARENRRIELYHQAKQVAESRYLEQWLGMYEGLNKKEAWELFTGGSGYPSLGTFYKHVKESGVISYMRWYFSNRFENSLKAMGINDSEIVDLLNERDRI